MPIYDHLMGWVDDPQQVEKICAEMKTPFFSMAAPQLKGSGDKTLNLLYKNFDKIGQEFPHQVQPIGSCVAYAWAMCNDVLAATEIANGEKEEFAGKTAAVFIYHTSRCMPDTGNRRLGRGDGSVGAWGAKALQKYGTLLRKNYEGIVDLSKISGQLEKEWGYTSRLKNDKIYDLADDHCVTDYTKCQNASDVVDSIRNNCPVNICSSQGFASRRDSAGFAKPSGSWAHSMAIIGVDTESSRPGVLINNSWPNGWISGPTRHDQPPNSFWVDLDVIDKMCRQMGDVWSIAGFNGYPKEPVEIDYRWWK